MKGNRGRWSRSAICSRSRAMLFLRRPEIDVLRVPRASAQKVEAEVLRQFFESFPMMSPAILYDVPFSSYREIFNPQD